MADADLRKSLRLELEALTAFLAGRPVGYPAAPGAWYEVDSGVFISGYAQVVVGPVPGGGRGYYVVFQRNC